MPYRTLKRADAATLPRGEMVEFTFGLEPTSALQQKTRWATLSATH